MKFETRKEKLKEGSVQCRSDGIQELRSCIRSGISPAAKGVNSPVVLYDLAFVTSEPTELHCSEPSAVDLFVPQANRLTLSCSNQAGRQSKPLLVLSLIHI